MKFQLSSILLFSLLATACGGVSAFSPVYPDNRSRDIEAVLTRMQAQTPPNRTLLAAGLTATPELFVIDMSTGKTLWKMPVSEPKSAPHIAGDVIVLHEGGEVVVRSAQSGQELSRLSSQSLGLVGAGGEGNLAALCLSTGGGVGATSQFVILKNGKVSASTELTQTLGVPVVRAGMIFVPWATQNVSIIDANSGSELARVRSTDTVIGHAKVYDGDVYLGQDGLFKFGSDITAGSSTRSTYVRPNLMRLPGDPKLLPNAYAPPPSASSALHKIRLAFRPTKSGKSEITYAIFYRFVFAFDPDGNLVWLYEHPEDIVGVSAKSAGIAIADQGGSLAFVNTTGVQVWQQKGIPSTVVSFDTTPFAPAGTGPAPEPLVQQLLSAARNSDNRLVPARELAVRMLAKQEDPSVAGALISLCDGEASPPLVKRAGCHALAISKSDGTAVLKSLQRHTRFLEDTKAGPVAPLAQAAIAGRLKDAVPALLAHLRDPETKTKDLFSIVNAVNALGDKTASEPLRDFLRNYRSDASEAAMLKALKATVDGIVALEGPVSQSALQELIDAPFVDGALRGHAQKALARFKETPAPAEATEATEDKKPAEALPEHITAQMVESILAPVTKQLKTCVRADTDHISAARIIVVVGPKGNTQMVSVSPTRLQSCIEPLVRSVSFPGNRVGSREQLIHSVGWR